MKVTSSIPKSSNIKQKLKYHASALGEDGTMYIAGGEDLQTCELSKQLSVLADNFSTSKLLGFENPEEYSCRGGSMIAHKNKVYFFGGVNEGEKYCPESRSVYLDPRKKPDWKIEDKVKGTWEVPHPSRQGQSWTPINGLYYMFGGMDFHEKLIRPGINVFNADKELWEFIHPIADSAGDIPSGRYYHMACSHGNELLILGGMGIAKVDDDRKIYRFDTTAKKWLKPYDLPKGLYPNGIAEGAMACVGNALCIIGGKESGIFMEFFTDEVRCDVEETLTLFDLEKKEWIVKCDVDGPFGHRSGCSAHAIGKNVFVVGGDLGNSSDGDVSVLSCELFDQQDEKLCQVFGKVDGSGKVDGDNVFANFFDSIEMMKSETGKREAFPPPKNIFDSLIINYKDGLQLNKWYGNKRQKWKLLYRATRDGWTSQNWHSKVDNKGETITILKSKNNGSIFGGYTPIAWQSNGGDKYDDKTWIFSLKNPHDDKQYKFNKIPQSVTRNRSCYHSSGYGFWVGNNDIIVYSNPNNNTSSNCNLGKAFEYKLSYNSATFFTGANSFSLLEKESFCLEKGKG